MALLLNNIKMPLSAALPELPALLAGCFGIPRESIRGIRLVRQSLDARKKQDIHFHISAVVQLEAKWQSKLLKTGDPRVQPYTQPARYTLETGRERAGGRIIVTGLGPAGLFAAYILAQAGYAPLVLERGRPVEQRAEDVARFWATGELRTESNVMFGEGGAGTFSDGKLTSRSKDPRVETVLQTLVDHGAPQDIAYMAKPHIGTDLLRGVVKSVREDICRLGGEVRFGAKLRGLRLQDGRITAVQVEQAGELETIPTAACVLATGQAARDTYEVLLHSGLVLQPKPFAVGLRIEHPQELIDGAQFGALAGDIRLGAAEYRMSARAGGRGVYSFCMCPGGQVVAASSGEGEVVTNGMSLRARGGENANAAIVVQVGPEDFGSSPLSGVHFQAMLERRAFLAGGGGYAAPAQRVADFLAGKGETLGGGVRPTYRPGVQAYSLHTLLPEYVTAGIQEGIRAFSRQLKGFDLADAVLTAVESRTSAPVRILRDESGEAANAKGLYPVGEGAGYAGGIVSAAIDGMRAAERIAARFAPNG